VTYSKADQLQIANEFDALPKGSMLRPVVVDYSKLRDACRVTL
jgi:hypothetical protein